MTIPPAVRRALARVRRDVAFLLSGVPLHVVMLPLWVLVLDPKKKVWALGVVWLVLLPLITAALTALQRGRYRALRGVYLPRPPDIPGRGPRRMLAWLRSAAARRQADYHLAGPVLAAAELTVLSCWVVGAAATLFYAWVYGLPQGWRPVETASPILGTYITAAGVLVLAAAPWLTGALAGMETRVATALLGPDRADRLQHRVADLAESRAGVVDAADAERRRIERDLHDGAQQRLVSLAVNLGLAKATLTGLPEEARRVIDGAHAEAKEAIAELSHLVRGLHPAVLEDRGLDAALSGLATRVPVPVRLRVTMDRRAPPAVEAVAYFVVSEALTNVTKHSQATRAGVTVQRTGAVLRVAVTDNGAGGGDPAGGSGLTGLAQRVRSVDGTLGIDSPPGGPTTITAELPCGR
jgi:signal transduction histidine kinase